MLAKKENLFIYSNFGRRDRRGGNTIFEMQTFIENVPYISKV